MSKGIKNDIDKWDGMEMKKCGYEFIGGCSELRRLKQENRELKEKIIKLSEKNGELTVENNTLALCEIVSSASTQIKKG